jgi:hypothetical protein
MRFRLHYFFLHASIAAYFLRHFAYAVISSFRHFIISISSCHYAIAVHGSLFRQRDARARAQRAATARGVQRARGAADFDASLSRRFDAASSSHWFADYCQAPLFSSLLIIFRFHHYFDISFRDYRFRFHLPLARSAIGCFSMFSFDTLYIALFAFTIDTYFIATPFRFHWLRLYISFHFLHDVFFAAFLSHTAAR